MRAGVVALYTAASAGAPVEPHGSVMAIAGLGIDGDRYACKRGHWSDPRWPDQELTLVELETAEALQIDASLLRRNVVTRALELDSLIGVHFQIGEALLFGVRRCDPCRYLETLTRPGLAQRLAGHGGLRVRILRGGRIATGDEIVRGGGGAEIAKRMTLGSA